MLTSLLDCGDDICRELVLLLRNKNTNVVTHIADIVSLLYCWLSILSFVFSWQN